MCLDDNHDNYEIESILRWRKFKRNKKIVRNYLVFWRGYPVEEATWIQAEQFSHPRQLNNYLEEGNLEEEKL